MPTKPKSKPQKNPVAAGSTERPFPHMDPDYPVRPWRDRATGRSFQTVTVRQEDGRFLSVVLEEPEVRFTGKTRRDAEEGVIKLYTGPVTNPRSEAEEDEEDLRVVQEREKNGRFYTLKEFMKRHGR